MKSMLLCLSIFSSFLLLAQEVFTKNFFSINTEERNSKKVVFSKKYTDSSSSFLLTVKNERSKDYTGCKWISTLSNNELDYFVDALNNIEEGVDFECPLFTLKYKRNRINVNFKHTKCTSEHKLYYFQKSCKRTLSFVLKNDQIPDIVNKLNSALNEFEFVKQ